MTYEGKYIIAIFKAINGGLEDLQDEITECIKDMEEIERCKPGKSLPIWQPSASDSDYGIGLPSEDTLTLAKQNSPHWIHR